ncbi:MAG: VCBS repeat-containing protein [bacterium]
MSAPFLGGFDVPRPQLVDVNGDGQLDLFVQERSGELMFFERVGGEWIWRSDRFQDLNIGEWFRFVSGDPDGKLRLFAEMPTGYIRVWRNEGSPTQPRFVALGDTVRDVDGRALAADRQNILTAADIDCNGKLDLFIGRVQGVVDRYEQDGNSPDGSPRFRLVEEHWQGIEVLGPEATGGTVRFDTSDVREHGPAERSATRLHGANTLAFADVDGRGNGVLDLFWGDFFEQGLLRFENTGSCAQPNLTGHPTRFPASRPVLTSGYNAPTFGDVDRDGSVDLVMGVIGGAYGPWRTSIENLYFVQQAPKGTWSVKTQRLIPTIDVGSESAPALADLNGDDLLDLIIGSKVSPTDHNSGSVTWYENIGSATAPSFRERGQLPIRGQFSYAPSVADLNGDGLPDIVLGTWNDRIQWYRNTGTRTAPAWTLADTALITITRGSNTAPSVGDLDGDGLVDMVIGKASGQIILYRNIGSKTVPKFQLVSDHFQDIKVNRRSAPLLVDMDGDGKLDMLIGSDDGDVQLWRGVGSAAKEIRFERDSTFVLKSYPNAIPAAGDLHHSGKLDLFVGTSSGGLRWFANPAS